MKKIKLTFTSTIFILLIVKPIGAQEPIIDWALQMGGAEIDVGKSITIDNLGNIYVTGWFSETVDFDPGPDTFNLTSAGGYDIFIQKLDASGNLTWVKRMGGNNNYGGHFDFSNAIKVDGAGNVYTTGRFNGVVDFDPGPGILNFVSDGTWDIYIQKLSPSGELIWAKHIENQGDDDDSFSMALDNLDNVYISGRFQEEGHSDIFAYKLDSDGNFIWTKLMDGTQSSYGESTSIAVDTTGFVYNFGEFYGTVDFDPGPDTLYLSSPVNWNYFVQKLDTMGNLIWVKQFGGTNQEFSESMVTDNLGNIYVTGEFEGTTDFDSGPDSLILISAGYRDIFVQKLDNLGNLLWVKQIGGTNIDHIFSIALDQNGNLYTTGAFNGAADFDPGPDSLVLNSNGNSDIFIQKLNNSGNLLWAKNIGSMGKDGGNSIVVNNIGDVYTTGAFRGTADFDPGPDSLVLSSAGIVDIFVMKFTTSTLDIKESENNLRVKVYPNPTSESLIIDREINSIINIYIFDNTGKLNVSKTSNEQITRIDMSNNSRGIYYLFISDGLNSTT